jgi:hypothetical protein
MSGLGIVLPWLGDRTPRDLSYAPLTIDRKRFCPHHHTRLEPNSRRVFCRDCGDELDAYEVLSNIAHDGDRIEQHRDQLRNQVASLEARVEELKREERNAKGRKRRRAG